MKLLQHPRYPDSRGGCTSSKCCYRFERDPLEPDDLFILINSSKVGFFPGPRVLPLRGNTLDLLLPLPLGLFLDVWCFFSWIVVEVEVDARVGLSEADNVEADGFDGNEGCGKREDGADTGFSSWRSFASRAAILSSVLV